MPSIEHDGVVELFRDNPALGPQLLQRIFHAEVPGYVDVRVADTQLTELSPIEYRADLVLELLDAEGGCVSAIVLESQFEVNPRKRFSWPAYVAVCRAERECPTGLLVVAVDGDVATWAQGTILLGFGAGEIRPFVLGPSVIPHITDDQEARRDPELAILSAMAHGNASEGLAVVLAALSALEGLERELAAVYFEVIWKSLRGPMQNALEALLMQRQTRHEVKFPPFIERLTLEAFRDGEVKGFHDGEVKGFHDGEVKALREKILRFARRRNVVLTDEQTTRVQTCADRALLDRWLDNVIDATSATDVFR